MPIMGRIAGGVAVVVAGTIAFVATCCPIGFVILSSVKGPLSRILFVFNLAWLVGAVTALLTGIRTYRLFFRSRRRPPDVGGTP